MRILMMTSRYGVGYGMGYSSYKEATGLAELGHDVTVVHLNERVDIYSAPRVMLLHLCPPTLPIADFDAFGEQLHCFATTCLDISTFDVLYIQSLEFGVWDFEHFCLPVFYFARSTMRGLRRALAKETWCKLPPQDLHNSLVSLEFRCMDRATTVIVKSDGMKMEVAELYGVPKVRIRVVSGGIDCVDFRHPSAPEVAAFRRRLMLSDGIHTLLYAGRIVPQKGLHRMLNAASFLRRDFEFVILVAGAAPDPDYFARITSQVRESAKSLKVVFLGHIDQFEMPTVLSGSDCLVTPSTYEPFGMVNLQAALLGKRVIATKACGAFEYAGMQRVAPESVEALVAAMRSVLVAEPGCETNHLEHQRYSWLNVVNDLTTCFRKT